MDIDREALEGIFGFFQVAYKSMGYFANFQHILFLSKLTFLHNHTSSWRFAIRDGTTEKSVRDEWGLFQWALTSRLCLAMFCHTCANPQYAERTTPFKRRCPRLDAVHAAALRMDTVSIVNGNECGRFCECWHKRSWISVIFYRYTNHGC